MSFSKTLFVVAFGVGLSACGTLISSPTQEITLNTPGADEAECMLDNGLRYPIRNGQTIRMMRSP